MPCRESHGSIEPMKGVDFRQFALVIFLAPCFDRLWHVIAERKIHPALHLALDAAVLQRSRVELGVVRVLLAIAQQAVPNP
jgi:hypothetical protein